MSVYVDGVRVNEAFGDIVSWDKIPSFAIQGMQVVPGSNPMYGLNTLGGAVAIQTKSGRNNQGAGVEFEVGSWGRKRSLAEFGGVSKDGSVDYYIGAQHTKEDGWRRYSPSQLNQIVAKIGWQNDTSKLDLTYITVDNKLTGNGFTPDHMLHGDNDQIHTRPDITNNYYHFLALNGSHWLNDATMLSGNLYYKKSNRSTLNGDATEGDECDAEWGVEKCAVWNRTRTSQDTYGTQGQFTFNQDFLGKKNQFVVGAGYDYSLIRFKQSEQLVEGFDASRRPSGELEDVEQTTGLTGKQYTARAFATDTLSLNDKWHVTGGASWNFTRVDNVDTLQGPRSVAGDASLTAKDSYTRLNPSIGLTHTPSDNLTLFTSYSESSRAPTSIELGCSNPNRPCLLPSAMADDPPLNQVVSKTYDFGARGNLNDSVRWNAAIYQTMNHDDIQFRAARDSAVGGYYSNVGRTQRQGLDLGLNGKHGQFSWNASYGFVRATYDSDVEFRNNANNSAATSSRFMAGSGDKIPGVPEHQAKLRLQYQVTPAWSVGTNIAAFAGQYVLGNENNKHQSGGVSVNGGNNGCNFGNANACGTGKLAGYTVVNLDTQYNFGQGWSAFAKATNIFDKEYYTGGRFAETTFGLDSAWNNDNEIKVLGVIPGAPRAGWVGVRYDFATPKAAQ
jgi:outer membrane receptor protein involved in Fe transport